MHNLVTSTDAAKTIPSAKLETIPNLEQGTLAVRQKGAREQVETCVERYLSEGKLSILPAVLAILKESGLRFYMDEERISPLKVLKEMFPSRVLSEDSWDNLEVDKLLLSILGVERQVDIIHCQRVTEAAALVRTFRDLPTDPVLVRLRQDAARELVENDALRKSITGLLERFPLSELLKFFQIPHDNGPYVWYRDNRGRMQDLDREARRIPKPQSLLLQALVQEIQNASQTEVGRHYVHGTTYTVEGAKPTSDVSFRTRGFRFWPYAIDPLVSTVFAVPLAVGAAALAVSSYGQAEMATKFLGPSAISALIGGIVLLAKFATDRGHVIKPLLNKARTQLSGMLNAAALLKELLLLNEFTARTKQPTAFPALVDHEGALFVAQDMGSPLHAMRQGLVVSDPEELRNGVPKGKFILNPAAITDDQIVLVIGPNSGGKTTWMKQVFSNLLLGQVGSRIFAAAGRLCPATKIAFSLPKQNSVDSEEGSFGEELAWVRPLLDEGVDRYTVLGCDELGRGTGEIASAPIAMDILRTLQLTGARIVLATHNSRLVESLQDGTLRFNVLHPEAVLTKQADGTQRIVLTKRILPGFPAAEVSPQAYAADVARRLGIGPEQLEELRRAIISERNSGQNDVR